MKEKKEKRSAEWWERMGYDGGGETITAGMIERRDESEKKVCSVEERVMRVHGDVCETKDPFDGCAVRCVVYVFTDIYCARRKKN